MTVEAGGAVAVRLLEPADVGFCAEQTRREGWTCTEEDFEIHLAHDPDGCFAAEAGGERVAMVTTTAYRETGWIGNLVVRPEHRGRGIGSLLMERAIAHLAARGLGTIRLEGDPLGIAIYRRLGFVDEYDSPRFRRDGGTPVAPSVAAPMGEADLPAAAALDGSAFGDERPELLRLLLGKAHAAFRVPAGGSLAGYVMLLAGTHGLRLGPWVAAEPAAARELLAAALSFAAGRTVTTAVPGPNRVACGLLAEAGFRETPSSLRMVRGPAIGRGRPERVFALANGGLG